MLSFSVFRKLQPRRPFTPLVPSLEGSFEGPLFSFVAEVSVEDPDLVGTQLGSPSLAPAGVHIRPSRHAQAREKKQLLLSSSKTRPYKSPSIVMPVSPLESGLTKTAGCHPQFAAPSPSSGPSTTVTSPFLLLSFHTVANCPFCNSFVLIFLHVMGGWRGCCVSSVLARSHVPTIPSIYPLYFHTLPHSLAQRESHICFSFNHLRTHSLATEGMGAAGSLCESSAPPVSLRYLFPTCHSCLRWPTQQLFIQLSTVDLSAPLFNGSRNTSHCHPWHRSVIIWKELRTNDL
jgi:hypothetical protein